MVEKSGKSVTKVTQFVEIEATGGMSRIIPDAKRELARSSGCIRISAMKKAAKGAIHALIVNTPIKYCRRLYRKQGVRSGVEQSTDIVPFRHCRSHYSRASIT